MSSAYHPQSDGQTEVLNKTLEMYLRYFVFDHPKTWFEMLPWAQLWYNTSFHHNIGMSPFKAVYGRDPPSVIPYELGESGPMVQPIAVLDSRVLLRDSSQVEQVLIQWEIAGPEEATWEDVTWVKASYPHFNLEDKVVYKGEGNVTCGKQEGKLVMLMVNTLPDCFSDPSDISFFSIPSLNLSALPNLQVQRINSAYFLKVNAIYQQMNRKLQQLESSPQEPNTLERIRFSMKVLENLLALLSVNKFQITTKFKEKLDKVEKFILRNFFSKNVSSRSQGQQPLADVQSRQQSDPSHSSISPSKILETKTSPQSLGTQNYHMMMNLSRQKNMCLQEQQVAKEYRNSQQSGPSHSCICLVKILETKPLPQSLATQNYHMMKDVSQKKKMYLQEQQVAKQYSNSQQSGPSHSNICPVKILETKPSPQSLGTQNYHMVKDVSQQKKMCLQEQQVAKQYSNSQQSGPSHSSICPVKILETKPSQQSLGTQNYHLMKDVSQQKKMCLQVQQVAKQYSNSEQSASPLIENSNMLKEISCKPTLTSDEPSAAMQCFLKVLTSSSPEALNASLGEIRKVVHLNDVIPSSELINGLGTNLASDIEPFSQDRYITCNGFVPRGRKRSRSMISMTAFGTSSIYTSSCDSNQLTDAEKPDLTLVTSTIKHPRIVEKCSLLEEIKEINKLLIDNEIVIGEKDSIQSAAGGAAEDAEGLVIKFFFNVVTCNQNLISHLSADKKSIIKPLWLLVPESYSFCPPVVLDKMPLEVLKI
ncbi:mediator of RNA polymerase II transcription subunit 15a-like [Glycine soja]|uniref:mediator of RNA polymerase II transcription subunit 15a-like n=1 Tax=Glycine soja TaxID=3848 RepID=UPI00103C5BB8|nr:mediator of RNA polymerase II transcription subunit 15a-like [Glycine soja]